MINERMTFGTPPGRHDQEAGAVGTNPVQAELRALSLALAARDAEIADLALRAADAAHAAADARARVRVLEGEIAERFGELAALSRLYLDADAGKSGSKVTARKAGDDNTPRDARIRQLELQHNLMLASTSWRVTAPLRRVVLWFRPHRPNKHKKADPSK